VNQAELVGHTSPPAPRQVPHQALPPLSLASDPAQLPQPLPQPSAQTSPQALSERPWADQHLFGRPYGRRQRAPFGRPLGRRSGYRFPLDGRTKVLDRPGGIDPIPDPCFRTDWRSRVSVSLRPPYSPDLGPGISWLWPTGGGVVLRREELRASCNKGLVGLAWITAAPGARRVNADPTPRPLECRPAPIAANRAWRS